MTTVLVPPAAGSEDGQRVSYWALQRFAEFADPHVVRGDDGYVYVFATTGDDKLVPALKAQSDSYWVDAGNEGDALASLPDWGGGETWAPSVAKIGKKWVMHFTERWGAVNRNRHCIGVAVSDGPSGPFEPAGDGPLLCDAGEGNHIDPFAFEDVDGSWWLLYKRDEGGRQVIAADKLTDDGLARAGTETVVISADLAWEAGVVENPALVRGSDGRLHLFWSAEDWRTDRYLTGHGICESPAGPCVKDSEPWLDDGIAGGPGGASFTEVIPGTDGDQAFMVFQRWVVTAGHDNGGHRGAYMAAVSFEPETPKIVNGTIHATLRPFFTKCDGRLVTAFAPSSGGAVSGTPGNDVIVGSRKADVLRGNGGNDRLCGLEGRDILVGGSGRDILLGGEGQDLLKGGKGRDRLNGELNNDRLDGGSGTDVCVAAGKSIRRCERS